VKTPETGFCPLPKDRRREGTYRTLCSLDFTSAWYLIIEVFHRTPFATSDSRETLLGEEPGSLVGFEWLVDY